jgi:hypothetical protein
MGKLIWAATLASGPPPHSSRSAQFLSPFFFSTMTLPYGPGCQPLCRASLSCGPCMSAPPSSFKPTNFCSSICKIPAARVASTQNKSGRRSAISPRPPAFPSPSFRLCFHRCLPVLDYIDPTNSLVHSCPWGEILLCSNPCGPRSPLAGCCGFNGAAENSIDIRARDQQTP